MTKKLLQTITKHTATLKGLGYQLSYDSLRVGRAKDVFTIKCEEESLNRLTMAQVEHFIKDSTPSKPKDITPEPEPKEENKD